MKLYEINEYEMNIKLYQIISIIIKLYEIMKLYQIIIKLYQIVSHGSIDRTIKRLQKNCIIIFITPFNRFTYGCSQYNANIDTIIAKISEQITQYNIAVIVV